MAESRTNLSLLPLVVALLATATLACAALLGGTAAGVVALVHHHPVVEQGVAAAQADPRVRQALGVPTKPRRIPADLSMKPRSVRVGLVLEGPLATGLLELQARRGYSGPWAWERAVVVLDRAEIDLTEGVDPEAAARRRVLDARDAYGEGLTLESQGLDAAALEAYDEAVALNPADSRAWLRRGDLLRRVGDTAGARESYRMAWDVDRSSLRPLASQALLSEEQQDWARCVEDWTRVLQRDAALGEAWLGRARCYKEQDMDRHALAGARKACDLEEPEACELARRWAR